MDLTEIIIAIIGLLGTIITVVAVPLIKGKTTEAQQKELAKWVKIAVSAAEQIFTGTELGKEKREYVLKWLEDNGYKLDDVKILSEVELLIEAFVSEMNNEKVRLAVQGN